MLLPFGSHARSFRWTKNAITISGSRVFHVPSSVRRSVSGVLLSMIRAPNLVLTFWVVTLFQYTPHHPAVAYVRPTGRASAIGFRSSLSLRTVSAFSFTRETLR